MTFTSKLFISFSLKFDFDAFITKQLIYFKAFATRIQKNKKKQLQSKAKKIEIALKIKKRKFDEKNKTIKTKNFVIKIFDNKFEKYFDDN